MTFFSQKLGPSMTMASAEKMMQHVQKGLGNRKSFSVQDLRPKVVEFLNLTGNPISPEDAMQFLARKGFLQTKDFKSFKVPNN